MNNLIIRQATLADADTIVAYNDAMAQETEGRELPADVVARGVRRVLAEPVLEDRQKRGQAPRQEASRSSSSRAGSEPVPVFDGPLGVYYLAEQDGRVVGQLLITFEFSDWRDGLFWWIQSVYVHPSARRGGVYRALHRHVEQEARKSGTACGLRLYVDKRNTRAQQVYRSLGLVPTEYDLYEADWSRSTNSE